MLKFYNSYTAELEVYFGVDTAVKGNNNDLELTVKSIVLNLLFFASSQIFKLDLLVN